MEKVRWASRGEGFDEDDPGEGKEVDPCISLHVTLNKKDDDGLYPDISIIPSPNRTFSGANSFWLACTLLLVMIKCFSFRLLIL